MTASQTTAQPRTRGSKPPETFNPEHFTVGDFVVCRVKAQSVSSAIIGKRGLDYEVVTRAGEVAYISHNAINCRDDWSPVAPVRVGDLAALRFHPGKVFRVTGFDEAAAVFDLANVADEAETVMSPRDGLRITRRGSLADVYRDLGLPVPEHLAAGRAPESDALPTGWWRKGGPAHWIQGDKALCGRELPANPVITSADPTDPDYQINQCKKCIKAMEKAGIIQPAPEGDMPFPVSEAELDAALAGAPSEVETRETIPAELPGTPVLLSPADSGITMQPLSRLFPWADQPRREFEQGPLDELAESIDHKGLMQNLTARPSPDGRLEVVIGGRRLRAMNSLVAKGRWQPDHLVAVAIRELNDLEALMLATAENVERRDMSPLEEADAFMRMVELGAAREDIALKFGYSGRVVEQRLTLAHGLGKEGRQLYQEGKIGLGQAQVIAQTNGPLRKHVLDAAQRGESVGTLTSLIKKHAFLVEHAKFDVEKSGLEVVPDLYGSTPAHFADSKAAMARQLDWVKERKATLEGKKEQYFVEVLHMDKPYLSLPYSVYDGYNPSKELRGTVIMVSTITGEIQEQRCARQADIKSLRAKEQAAERKKNTADATGEEGGAIRKSAFVDGHRARASALRGALVGDHRRTLALGILALLGSIPVPLRATYQDVQHAPHPKAMQRLQELDSKLGGALRVDPDLTRGLPLALHLGYDSEGRADYALLQKLLTLSLEELLDLHGILIALAVGGWSEYNPQHAPYHFVTCLASDVGAKVSVKLTDEHLKAYPRDRLVELAKDAGLQYIVDNAARYPTNTALRGAILEMADELHRDGYVPPICRFPEPDAAVLAQEQADQQYRDEAVALIGRLTDEQVKELASDFWEVDTAERDTVEALRTDLLAAIDDMDIDELRGWPMLRDLARALGPITQTAAD